MTKKVKKGGNKKNSDKGKSIQITIPSFLTGKRVIISILIIAIAFIGIFGTIDFLSDGPIKTKLVCNEQKTIQKGLDATVKVIASFGSGSGFFISPTQIITNNHVVEGMAINDEVEIELKNEYKIKGKIIGGDPVADIAIIETSKHSNDTYLKWANSTKQGESLWVIGYPLSDQEVLAGEATVTNGLLSATRNDSRSGAEFIQTNASIKYGNSGGPIVNKCGKVVAVSDFIYKYDETTDSIAYGISFNSAKKSKDEILASEHPILGTQPSFQEDIDPTQLINAYYASMNDIFDRYPLDQRTTKEYHDEMTAVYWYFFTQNRIKGLSYEEWVEQWELTWYLEPKDMIVDKDNPHRVLMTLVNTMSDGYQDVDAIIQVAWGLDYSIGLLLLDKYEVLGEASFEQYIGEEYMASIEEEKELFAIYDDLAKTNIAGYPSHKKEEFNSLYRELKPLFDQLYSRWSNKEILEGEDYDTYDAFFEKRERLVELAQEIWNHMERESLKNEVRQEIMQSIR